MGLRIPRKAVTRLLPVGVCALGLLVCTTAELAEPARQRPSPVSQDGDRARPSSSAEAVVEQRRERSRRGARQRSRRSLDPAAPTPSMASVRMIPETSVPRVGDRVVVHVEIEGASDVGSVPFHVRYDPAVLRFEYASEGPLLGSDGRETAFFAAPASVPGRVAVGLSRLGRGDGVVGRGKLCSLVFTAVGPGRTSLAFWRAKIRDSANEIRPARFAGTAIAVR